MQGAYRQKPLAIQSQKLLSTLLDVEKIECENVDFVLLSFFFLLGHLFVSSHITQNYRLYTNVPGVHLGVARGALAPLIKCCPHLDFKLYNCSTNNTRNNMEDQKAQLACKCTINSTKLFSYYLNCNSSIFLFHVSTTSSKWLSINSAGDSIVISTRFERFLLLRLLRRRVFIRFIREKLICTDAVVTGMDRLIKASLLKMGNNVFITSLKTRSRSWFDNSWRYVFRSVTVSQVRIASLLVDSPSNVSAGFAAP